MEDKLQPSEMSASGLSGNSILQQGKWKFEGFCTFDDNLKIENYFQALEQRLI